jgi:hypothetical protein
MVFNLILGEGHLINFEIEKNSFLYEGFFNLIVGKSFEIQFLDQ